MSDFATNPTIVKLLERVRTNRANKAAMSGGVDIDHRRGSREVISR